MAGGELKRVERFEELTPGVRVVFRCRRESDPAPCYREHGSMVARVGEAGMVPVGAYVEPMPSCMPGSANGFVLTPEDVAEGLVFRRVDFDADSAEERATLGQIAEERIQSALRWRDAARRLVREGSWVREVTKKDLGLE